MGWFDKGLEFVSPQWALRREVARQNLAMYRKMASSYHERSFDAIDGSRLRAGLKTASGNIDSEIYNNIETLRNHVRQMEFNNGSIAGPIQRWTNYVVGPGLRFQARVRADKKGSRMGELGRITETIAEEFNEQAERRFKSWQIHADQKMQLSFYRLMWVAEAARMRDGEVLAIVNKSKNPERHGGIPTCIDLLEIDRLWTPLDAIGDTSIRNGIRFDSEGAPEAYCILRQHPGDCQTIPRKLWEYDWVPAYNPNGTKKVIHLFRTLRPEQTRGFSTFAAGLSALTTVGRYREAELFAALGDACTFGIAIVKNPVTFQANSTVVDPNNADSTKRVTEIAPGKIMYLQDTESFQHHKPTRPNESFKQNVHAFLEDAANVIDMPLEVMMQDWHDINYSNARTILLQLYIPVYLAQLYLTDALCNPVWENVLADLVAVGKLRAPGYIDRKEDYLECAWITPKKDWVDPRNETDAKINELSMGVTSPGEICASQGKDDEEILEGISKRLRKIKEIEERDGIEFPAIIKNLGSKTTSTAQADQGQGEEDKPKPKVVKNA